MFIWEIFRPRASGYMINDFGSSVYLHIGRLAYFDPSSIIISFSQIFGYNQLYYKHVNRYHSQEAAEKWIPCNQCPLHYPTGKSSKVRLDQVRLRNWSIETSAPCTIPQVSQVRLG